MAEDPLEFSPMEGEDPSCYENEIAQMLGQYIDRINSGETISTEAIFSEYPTIAPAIVSELRNLQLLDDSNGPSPLGTLGDYTLRRQIGRGGMGVVYEAWQNSVDRQVALKVLPGAVAADDKAFHRFMREARTAAKLNHPNVVGVYGMGQEEYTPYYSMEYVKGNTLAQILSTMKEAKPEAETPFGPKDQVDYFAKLARAFADIADGLQHAHSKGVIHRDIKPSNLILDQEGRLRILDFGLARLEGQESLTISGDFLGTVLYMSPEQAMAKRIPIDHRTDIYSLGATMYEMLACRPVFGGKSREHTLSQIITRDPVPLRQRNPRIPKSLETIVLKCLRKAQDDRYGSAEALTQDLRRFLRGDPIEARPQLLVEKLAWRAWRIRGRIVAACLVVLFLLTGAILLHKEWREREEARLRAYQNQVLRAVGLIEENRFIEPVYDRQRRRRLIENQARGDSQESPDQQIPVQTGVPEFLEESVTLLKAAVQEFPRKTEALYYLADALWLLGRKADARTVLKKALRCDPRLVPARILETVILEDLGENVEARKKREGVKVLAGSGLPEAWLDMYDAKRREDWKKAVEAYTKLIDYKAPFSQRNSAFSLRLRLGRGRARLETEDFVGALADFSMAQAIWPELATPVILSGKAYFLLEQKERAERIFLALTEDPPAGVDLLRLRISGLYYDLQEYEKCLNWLEKAGESARREKLRALALSRLGRHKEALRSARRATELDPDDANGYNVLGNAFTYLGMFEDALNAYHKAIRADPKCTFYYRNMALVLSGQGRHQESVDALQEAMNLNPSLDLHNMLGYAYCDLGQRENAIGCFREAIHRNPEGMVSYFNLAVNSMYLKKLGEAKEEFEELKERYPEAAGVYFGLGIVLGHLKKNDEAIPMYRRAIELAPANPEPYEVLANTLSYSGEIDEALELCDRVIKLRPHDWNFHYRRGRILGRKGEPTEALKAFEKAASLDPNRGDPHLRMGELLRLQGETKRALEALKKAFRLGLNNPERYNMLGGEFWHLEMWDDATKCFREALHRAPQISLYRIHLAHSLLREGKRDQAIEVCRKAMDLDSRDPDDYKKLGIILKEAGMADKAKEAFKRADELKSAR